jgi:hypothetical protein
MNKREIKKAIQGWYDSANWYGYVDTPIGRLTDMQVSMLATELNVKLTFNPSL